MRHLIFTFLLTLLMAGGMLAQAPEAFQYQAVVRDSDGNIRADADVTIGIRILQGSSDGTEVYSEEHDVTTSSNGLVNLMIGKGNTSDMLSSIDWSNNPFFIEISVDGSVMGTSQLLSVPYAKFADKSADSFSGSYNDLSDVPANIDEDATDDFSGDYNDLLAKPKHIDTDSTNDITTSSNLIPIAIGNIDNDATIEGGTGNFTCTWNSTYSRYEISINNTTFTAHYPFAVMVTPYFSDGGITVNVSSVGGDMLVELYDETNSLVQGEFYFVVYGF